MKTQTLVVSCVTTLLTKDDYEIAGGGWGIGVGGCRRDNNYLKRQRHSLAKFQIFIKFLMVKDCKKNVWESNISEELK